MRSQSISTFQNIFTLDGLIYNLRILPEDIAKFFVPAFFSVMPAFSLAATITGIGFIAAIISAITLLRKKINFKMVITGTVIFLVPLVPSLIYKPQIGRAHV